MSGKIKGVRVYDGSGWSQNLYPFKVDADNVDYLSYGSLTDVVGTRTDETDTDSIYTRIENLEAALAAQNKRFSKIGQSSLYSENSVAITDAGVNCIVIDNIPLTKNSEVKTRYLITVNVLPNSAVSATRTLSLVPITSEDVYSQTSASYSSTGATSIQYQYYLELNEGSGSSLINLFMNSDTTEVLQTAQVSVTCLGTYSVNKDAPAGDDDPNA